MCTSQEAKQFYTLCFSSSFLFNVVIICHFSTVDTLEICEKPNVIPLSPQGDFIQPFTIKQCGVCLH